MELTNPWALLLLAAVPIALFVRRRSLAGLEGRRDAAATALRLLILVLLAVASAGPRLKFGSSDMSVVFLGRKNDLALIRHRLNGI